MKCSKCPKGFHCVVTHEVEGNNPAKGEKHFSCSKDAEDKNEPVVCSCWNKDIFTATK